MEQIKQVYPSPRWTGEVCDCSMPMTFDTYSICSYNCLYCFAFFQKVPMMGSSYLDRKVTSVSVKKFRDLLWLAKGKELGYVGKEMRSFLPYIQQGRTMQWGGMSDPLDEYEREYGISLELLRLFDVHDFPLSISTKGTWWTEDERYMELVREHAHNWHFKISIITLDPFKAKIIEKGVDSPKKRLQAIRRLVDAGCHVTLRLRPYLLGISEDWRDLITAGAEAGADSVTTEFFCLEGRAQTGLKARYAQMSRVCGFDLLEFYKKNSTRSGYYRLNYDLKAPIIKAMKDHAHNLKMRFYVSDADHKAKSDFTCCCGVPPEWKVSHGQFTESLMIAKKRAREGKRPLMYWSDISDEVDAIMSEVNCVGSTSIKVTRQNARLRARYKGFMLSEWLRIQWNNPDSGYSPSKYFGAPVTPIGIDDNGDTIYLLSMKHIKTKREKEGGE